MTTICLNPWLIKKKDEPLAWSNEDGWVCASNDWPDRFTQQERETLSLPMDGEWFLADPRLVETSERTNYWEVEVGLYQATKIGDPPPRQNGAGYPDLAALKKLKGDR